VLIGAHYDHLGHNCRTSDPTDTICNGATDNSASDAEVLAIARSIAAQPTPPRRSILIAFWDREEDGLLGSQYYTQHPIVPLADTVAEITFDIQGANLRPSLRNTTFAIASETGGSALEGMVQSAIDEQTLDAERLSSIFGEGRSDYTSFLNVGVPSVFFSDATGPCYHTAQDQIGVVDFAKLAQQTAISLDVTRRLADADTPPTFVANAPLATYDDAIAITRVYERVWNDRDSFSTVDRASIAQSKANAEAIVARGRAAFSSSDVSTLLSGAAAAVNIFTHGTCSGFLAPSS
jgi:Peptidase family M28